MRILVTDLDGTLLGGETADRRRLCVALARHREVTVVFATGRGVGSVAEVLCDPLVPSRAGLSPMSAPPSSTAPTCGRSAIFRTTFVPDGLGHNEFCKH